VPPLAVGVASRSRSDPEGLGPRCAVREDGGMLGADCRRHGRQDIGRRWKRESPVYVQRSGFARRDLRDCGHLRRELGDKEFERIRPARSASTPTTNASPGLRQLMAQRKFALDTWPRRLGVTDPEAGHQRVTVRDGCGSGDRRSDVRRLIGAEERHRLVTRLTLPCARPEGASAANRPAEVSLPAAENPHSCPKAAAYCGSNAASSPLESETNLDGLSHATEHRNLGSRRRHLRHSAG